jgi:hypothetical protein
MSLTCYNLSEDWGWYIDIERSNPVYQIRTDFVKIPCKKFNQHYNKLDIIEEDADEDADEDEDEYEYHINNLKKLDDISSKNIDVNIERSNQYYVKKMFSVGSTTMLTALLTYVVFYML